MKNNFWMQLTGGCKRLIPKYVCLTDFKVPELAFKLSIHAASVPYYHNMYPYKPQRKL